MPAGPLLAPDTDRRCDDRHERDDLFGGRPDRDEMPLVPARSALKPNDLFGSSSPHTPKAGHIFCRPWFIFRLFTTAGTWLQSIFVIFRSPRFIDVAIRRPHYENPRNEFDLVARGACS